MHCKQTAEIARRGFRWKPPSAGAKHRITVEGTVRSYELWMGFFDVLLQFTLGIKARIGA